MSDDAIQDLLDHYDLAPESDANGNMRTSEPSSHIVDRAQAQHTANRDVIASLRSSLEGRAAEVAQLESAIADHVIAEAIDCYSDGASEADRIERWIREARR